MQVTLEIPDAIAGSVVAAVQDPARVFLEEALVQSYQTHKITSEQLMEALGFDDRYELEGFLKERGVWLAYTPEQEASDQAFQDAFVAQYRQTPSA